MIRDTWRAILVLTVGCLLVEASRLDRQVPAVQPAQPAAPAWPPPMQGSWGPPPAVATNWQPPPPIVATERPIRRVARTLVDLADSVLEVIR